MEASFATEASFVGAMAGLVAGPGGWTRVRGKAVDYSRFPSKAV